MAWNKLLFGSRPRNFEEAEGMIRRSGWFNVLWTIIIILILVAVLQQRAEINSCWSQLEPLQVQQQIFEGGFPEASCDVVDGYVVCGIDNFTLVS